MTIFTSLVVSACAAADYLSVDLRERVEDLKQSAQSTVTSPANIDRRARTLLAWANAYSLAGGVTPVELPLNAGLVTGYKLQARAGVSLAWTLDQMIQEMRLRDEQPEAIGTLTTSTLGPFRAGSFVSFSQTYTVGSQPLKAGGGIMIARHIFNTGGRYQTDNPEADNYISITSSNESARFKVDSYLMSGMHGGFRSAASTIVFRLQGTTLEQGDSVTINYGDTSQGNRGLLIQDYSNDRGPHPLYVDLEGEDLFLTLPIQPFKIVGTDIKGVHGFVPSVLEPGETFEISVRVQDRFGNAASGSIPAWQVFIDDRLYREVPAGDQSIVVLKNVSIAEPGVHRISIRSKDGAIEGKTNPVLVEKDPEHRIYWGDTHGHSGFAEGVGSAEGYMRFARDEARLDYVTHSEHDIWLDDGEWKILRDNVEKYSQDGRFVAFLGYEWSVNNTGGGHHNVLFRTPNDRKRIPMQFYPTLSRLYTGLRNHNSASDVLIIPHAHQNGDYRQSDPELEHLVEIMSGHGTFEWWAKMYLNHGHQVGFVAASDDHLGHPGYSVPRGAAIAQRGGLGAVLAGEKTADALFDSMKARRVYATTGDRIILQVDVNGTGMGQRAPYSEKRKIVGRVIGTGAINNITIVKNDTAIWSGNYGFSNQVKSVAGYQLKFQSDSTAFHPRDNPRGWRVWQGTAEIKGATLVSAEPTDFTNPSVHQFSIDEKNPNLIRFTTLTRGDSSSIDLVFEGAGNTTEVILDLKTAQERGGAPQLYRRHGRIPAWKTTFPLKEMVNGRLSRINEFQGYQDSVMLRRLVRDGKQERQFEFVDDDNPRQGDYYYVRVVQANDAIAWSSPVWIGGYAKK
ncbi:MAG: DUF3604 domain-containing protein [bacterium]